MKKLLSKLSKEFEMTTMKNPDTYLEMQITRTVGGLFLHQETYANKVLLKYDMQNAKPMPTPLAAGGEEDTTTETKFQYRQAVGSLLYLSGKARPDLAFSVNYESRRTERPTIQDTKKCETNSPLLESNQEFGNFLQNHKQQRRTKVRSLL